MATEQQFVMVPVPPELVTEVMALIASRAGSPPPSARTSPSKEPRSGHTQPVELGEQEATRQVEWTEALLRRNWQDSPPTVRALLGHLADHPDMLVPITELARAVYEDGDRSKLAGVLGAFGRRTKNRYNATTWPFYIEWNWDLEVWQYCMPGWVAEIIRGLRD